MKTLLAILMVGGVCLLTGLFIGARVGHQQEIAEVANSYTEATEALNIASALSVDVGAVERLHKGRTNEVLDILISRVDANIVRLANRKTIARANGQSEILYETNTLPALNLALAYRKTNSWMNNYGFIALKTNDPSGIFGNNIITSELQKLLAKP